ncbi:outer membrane receptor protein involved in Fe transport [Sphingosinicella soli]|uniref:Outer membrane receptor protein involved in Fe transport n=2 Tax=Sphingosinicella soli TaxID=333708 RepID=A0A7W7FAL4_9SPHN|nr:outer membrane receptor protein involved in Fe transport [Sphingosinicella soli]
MIDALILAISVPEWTGRSEVSDRQEIVVTGERISRSKHDTASSVAAETGEEIDNRATPDRIEQLLQAIPNVQLGSGGEGPVIRGQDSTGVVRDLPAFLAGTRPRTTITIDGRSATYYELAFGLTSVWDVGRVEVFRSPQTTTQGRNSIGGAIFVETKVPSFDWEGRVRFVAGESDTRQVSGVVSGPMIDGQLAFRLSGDLRRSQTSSQITNGAVGINPNRDDSELLRVKLLAEPKGLPDTHLDLTYSRGRSQMPQIEGIELPYRERGNPNAGYGVFAITVDSLTGRVVYEPAGGLHARATLTYGEADVRRHPRPGLGAVCIHRIPFELEF